MCTAFIKKGSDILFGYNLDVDPAVWNFRIVRKPNLFSVGITVGDTEYLTHGVNSLGQFSNLPYMNGPVHENGRAIDGSHRLDILVDRYIKGEYRFGNVMDIVGNSIIVNNPGLSMHSLFGDREGNMLLVEPEFGFRRLSGAFAVATNFPILTKIDASSNPFFGKDRYDTATEILKQSTNDFDVSDGLELLKKVSENNQWGTRLSFVYSKNENAVYYVLDRDFDNVQKWVFTE